MKLAKLHIHLDAEEMANKFGGNLSEYKKQVKIMYDQLKKRKNDLYQAITE